MSNQYTSPELGSRWLHRKGKPVLYHVTAILPDGSVVLAWKSLFGGTEWQATNVSRKEFTEEYTPYHEVPKVGDKFRHRSGEYTVEVLTVHDDDGTKLVLHRTHGETRGRGRYNVHTVGEFHARHTEKL